MVLKLNNLIILIARSETGLLMRRSRMVSANLIQECDKTNSADPEENVDSE